MSADGESELTMVDVLEQQTAAEEDAHAVLGGSDENECTYEGGYVRRQALYACLTCRPPGRPPAGVCLACSLSCHERHELVELYTKRNFRCDCGGPAFDGPCNFGGKRDRPNSLNRYNHNFDGVYCRCERPYPDPDATTEDDMIQCVVCEDWLHAGHLNARVPHNDRYAEMTCDRCVEKNDFLKDYAALAVDEDDTIDVTMSDSVADTSVAPSIDATMSDSVADVSAAPLIEAEVEPAKSADDLKDHESPEKVVDSADQIKNIVKSVSNDESAPIPKNEEPSVDSEPIPPNDKESPDRIENIAELIPKDEVALITEELPVDSEPIPSNDKESPDQIENVAELLPNDESAVISEEVRVPAKNEELPVDSATIQSNENESAEPSKPLGEVESKSNPDPVVCSENDSEVPSENGVALPENSEKTQIENGSDSIENSGDAAAFKSEETNLKRKIDDGDVAKIDSVSENGDSVKKQKTEKKCVRPSRDRNSDRVGALFWPNDWRTKLCSCEVCVDMYREKDVSFLLDTEDTVIAYENLGKMKKPSSQYEKGLEALSSLDRIQQINAITEYNKMKEKLLEFLKTFKDKREVVREEDIKGFFAGMKPKREPDGVYFCR